MTFQTMMDSDMSDIILNSAEFAETLTYVDSAGTETSIKAVVERDPVQTGVEEDGRSLSTIFEVFIANDADNGRTSISIGKDKIKIPVNLGDTASDFLITEVVKHDSAAWHLRCIK